MDIPNCHRLASVLRKLGVLWRASWERLLRRVCQRKSDSMWTVARGVLDKSLPRSLAGDCRRLGTVGKKTYQGR